MKRGFAKTLFRGTLIAFGLLLVTLVAAILYFGRTDTGTRQLMGLAQQLAPGQLSIDETRGRLLDDLTLQRISYQHGGLDVSIARLQLVWQPSSLFRGHLHVQRLHLHTIEAVLPPGEDTESGDFVYEGIALPLTMQLDDLAISNARIDTGGDAKPIALARLRLEAQASERSITLKELSAAAFDAQLFVQGQLGLGAKLPHELDVSWQYEPADLPALSGQGLLAGDLDQVQFTQALAAPAQLEMKARVANLVAQPDWDLDLKLLAVDLAAFVPELGGVLEGRLSANGQLAEGVIEGALDISNTTQGDLRARLDGRFSGPQLHLTDLVLQPDVGGTLSMQGDLDLGGPAPQFDANVTWDALRWPWLQNEPPTFSSREGNLSISGTTGHFNYALALDATLPEQPGMNLTAEGSGNTSGAQLTQLVLAVADGTIRGNGNISWQQAPAWSLQLSGSDLDVARFVADLPGHIGFDLNTRGRLQDGLPYGEVHLQNLNGGLRDAALAGDALIRLAGDEVELLRSQISSGEAELSATAKVGLEPLSWSARLSASRLDPGLFDTRFPGRLDFQVLSSGKLADTGPDFTAELQALRGELRGYPVAGQAKVAMREDRLNIDQLNLRSGEATLVASGQLGQTYDLNWKLNATDMGQLLPDLAGALNAEGRLTGLQRRPRLQATLQGAGIEYGDVSLRKLSGQADLGLAADEPIVLALDVDEPRVGSDTWQNWRINVDGTRAAHRIQARLEGQQAPSANLALQAGLNSADEWRGSVEQLEIRLPDLGEWRLAEAAAFHVAEARQALSRLCLQTQGSELCLQGENTIARGWRGELQASSLSLAMFSRWLPADSTLAGRLDLEAQFAGTPEGAVSGNARLAVPDGQMAYRVQDTQQVLDFSGARSDLSLGQKGGNADLELPLADLGQVTGQLRLPGFKPGAPLGSQALRGQLKADIGNLALLAAVVPALSEPRGRLNADVTLSGTLLQPRVQGVAEIRGAEVGVPDLGLTLQDIELVARSIESDKLRVQGQVMSGQGRLELEGEVTLDGKQGFPSRFALKGQDWLTVNVPEAEGWISPDIQLRRTAGETHLEGELGVPFARLRPRNLPASAKTNSSDLVVVKAEDANADRQAAAKVHASLRIRLGDRVSFEGFGLRSRFSGNLLVKEEPGRPVTGNGRLALEDATYRAYGQDLKIERGHVLYADTPLDNPALDMRAVREVDSITAGLKVTGRLKNPKLEVFSIPAMTQTEALSYLLTGRPPGRTSGGNTNLAALLAAGGAGTLTEEAGRQLGLDELRLETGETLDSASVVAGTYLSPRLYVQYVADLANNDPKLRLRYDLTEHIQLQSESGASQGADIFYTIER